MSTNKTNLNLQEFEEYTEKEIEYIDKYKAISGNIMEVYNLLIQDEELYDLIIKYNFDDNRIIQEVQNHVQLLKKKGDDYTWGVVSKGKSKLMLNIQNKSKQRKNRFNRLKKNSIIIIKILRENRETKGITTIHKTWKIHRISMKIEDIEPEEIEVIVEIVEEEEEEEKEEIVEEEEILSIIKNILKHILSMIFQQKSKTRPKIHKMF